MSKTYKLSKKAEYDLDDIADFTIENWGLNQADIYMLEMHDCLTTLAENNLIGRDASEFAQDLCRLPFKAHTIFYTPTQDGVFVVRILGKSQDFPQYF